MNQIDPLVQMQQQLEAAAARASEQMWWLSGYIICFYILGLLVTFFVLRWFLLHVFGIQQKRFFAELDLFLYQRGIAVRVPESYSPPRPQQAVETSRVKEVVKDLVATVDRFAEPKQTKPKEAAKLDETAMERAWRELQNSGRPDVASDDARFMPKE